MATATTSACRSFPPAAAARPHRPAARGPPARRPRPSTIRTGSRSSLVTEQIVRPSPVSEGPPPLTLFTTPSRRPLVLLVLALLLSAGRGVGVARVHPAAPCGLLAGAPARPGEAR